MNENQALYTKYRPQKFSDVLGQEHITSVLKDTLKNTGISHAYLFSGSRGTGKTSIARILANEIGTTSKDLYEIDAASNTSVEDVRSLNESVSTLPFDSKYKVYILDEVHMLSKSAFNALLKTLEEPPKHVVFILATTEPEKIPDTVISRCEHYTFKTPNRSLLKKMAINVAKQEGYELEPSAAELIAILGDGSFRDTHTTLQKLIRSSADKKLTLEETEKVTGAPKVELINDIVKSLISHDLGLGLSAISKAEEDNLDSKVIYKLVLEKIRAALILKVSKDKKGLFSDSISDDDMIILEKLVGEYGDNLNSKVLLNILEAYELSSRSPLPLLSLELVLIDFIDIKG
jgi:DNA polymerase-3 subunit gamma/tau